MALMIVSMIHLFFFVIKEKKNENVDLKLPCIKPTIWAEDVYHKIS
jgi:hypothetical protein